MTKSASRVEFHAKFPLLQRSRLLLKTRADDRCSGEIFFYSFFSVHTHLCLRQLTYVHKFSGAAKILNNIIQRSHGWTKACAVCFASGANRKDCAGKLSATWVLADFSQCPKKQTPLQFMNAFPSPCFRLFISVSLRTRRSPPHAPPLISISAIIAWPKLTWGWCSLFSFFFLFKIEKKQKIQKIQTKSRAVSIRRGLIAENASLIHL